jgi:enamine deaminase RidA (YjgF/YER057c/UK114 family)
MAATAASVRLMGTIEERLRELEIELPAPLAARDQGLNYVLVNVAGSLAYLAGHGPQDGAQPTPLMTGRIGDDLSPEEGYRAARLVGLAMLASLKQELGELDRVSRWLRAVGYINAAHDFTGHALVLNGFSDLIVEIWGDAGYHTRAAPGAATLPFNVPVIVEATVQLD